MELTPQTTPQDPIKPRGYSRGSDDVSKLRQAHKWLQSKNKKFIVPFDQFKADLDGDEQRLINTYNWIREHNPDFQVDYDKFATDMGYVVKKKADPILDNGLAGSQELPASTTAPSSASLQSSEKTDVDRPNSVVSQNFDPDLSRLIAIDPATLTLKEKSPEQVRDEDTIQRLGTPLNTENADKATADRLITDLDKQFNPEDYQEQNPLVTGGKSIWNVLSYQLPSAAASTLAAITPENSGNPYVPASPKDIESVRAAKTELVKWADKRQGKGAEFTKDLVDNLDKVNPSDPIDWLNYVFNAGGAAAGQIPLSVASGGSSAIMQEVGAIYLESVQRIAQENGLTVEEVVKQGKDEPAFALTYGIAAGILEKMGAEHVLRGFTRQAIRKSFGARALSVVGGTVVEGSTEYMQTILEQLGVEQSAGESFGDALMDIMTNPEKWKERREALVQGMIGGTTLSTAGEIKSHIDEKNQKSKSNDTPTGKQTPEQKEAEASTAESEDTKPADNVDPVPHVAAEGKEAKPAEVKAEAEKQDAKDVQAVAAESSVDDVKVSAQTESDEVSGDVTEREKDAPSTFKSGKNTFTVIGTNADGEKIGVAENGIRARLINDKIVVTQAVAMVPTEQGIQMQFGTPDKDFFTTDELKQQTDETVNPTPGKTADEGKLSENAKEEKVQAEIPQDDAQQVKVANPQVITDKFRAMSLGEKTPEGAIIENEQGETFRVTKVLHKDGWDSQYQIVDAEGQEHVIRASQDFYTSDKPFTPKAGYALVEKKGPISIYKNTEGDQFEVRPSRDGKRFLLYKDGKFTAYEASDMASIPDVIERYKKSDMAKIRKIADADPRIVIAKPADHGAKREDVKTDASEQTTTPDAGATPRSDAGGQQSDVRPLTKDVQTDDESAPKSGTHPRSAKVEKEIDDLFSELDAVLKPRKITSGVDPQAAVIGAKIVAKYVELGVVKFAEIAQEVYKRYGEERLRDYFHAMKAGYASTQQTIEDEEVHKQMDPSVRQYNVDDLLKQFNNDDNTGKETAVGSGRTDSRPAGDDAGRPEEGTESRKSRRSQKTDDGTGGDVRAEENQSGTDRDGTATSSPDSDRRSTRPESVVQENFVYPENWERNQNKTFSKRQAYADNIAALEVINTLLDNPGTFATPEQQEILSRYNGLGPLGEILLSDNRNSGEWNKSSLEFFDDAQRLKQLLQEIGKKTGTKPLETARASTLSAYYTSLPVIRAMWKGLEAAGFSGGRVLEGSVGSGRFIGGMPKSIMNASKIKGVDMDVVSALIAKYLYPKAAIVNSPIQAASLPSNTYDLFISNIPFGSARIYDPVIDKKGPLWKQAQGKVHTYFFAKAIDVVRPGGYLAILTTSNVLDTPSNQATRDLINQETDFVGAVRLPASTFDSDAGTQVVTDILFLRKKLTPGNTEESVIDNVVTKKVPHKYPNNPWQDVQYNKYFEDHPDQMFGDKILAGGLYSADRGYTLEGQADPDKVAAKLAQIAEKMPIQDRPASEEETQKTLQMTPLGRMISGGIVEQGGKYYRVQDYDSATGKYTLEEIKKSVMPSEKDMPILQEYVTIKNLYFSILGKDKSGVDASADRKQLRKFLDKFIRTIKPSNLGSLGSGNRAVSRLLKGDPDFFAITALQKPDGSLSDVVDQPVARDTTQFEKTDSPADAIAFSINNFGRINMPFIQKVLGVSSEQEALAILEPEIFETPDGEVIERTEYLSGNVREKLEQAEQWAKADEKFKKNVDALTAVIPADIPAHDIKFQFGAAWIPLSYTQQFLDTVFGKGKITVKYTKQTDDYGIEVHGEQHPEYIATGNDETRGNDVVIKAAMSKFVPDFYRVTKDVDGKEIRTPLPQLTQDVRDKAERLQAEFEGLIEADQQIQTELSALYNKNFNALVNKLHDGSKLTFPGMQGYQLNPHQKDAIMLMIQKQGGMVDHIVGAGKSLVMSVGAIKMKQLGLVNKPMIATMKSVVPGLIAEAKRQYPDAKILAPKENDFSAANRQRLFAQIANNDWDLIIISHENLGTIPLPAEFEKEYVDNEIQELREALLEIDGSDSYGKRQQKALENRIMNLQARLQKLQDKGKSVSRTDFGTMGIDFLQVDESQQFKNLNFVTKLRNVAGLGTSKGSNRAANLKMVSRYLQKMHGGDKGIVFASGTPISNSLVELYNIFQYLRPSLLQKLGMVSLDQFLKNFAEISSIMEKNVAGVVKNRTRLTKFVNVPELASFYTEMSDIRGTHNLVLPRPDIKGGKPDLVLVPQSETVKTITDAIYKTSDTKNLEYLHAIGIRPQGDAEKAIGLVLTTLGKKASIDPRMIFPGTRADGGKTFAVSKEVAQIYKDTKKEKGVQLIFADMGTPKNKNAPLGERVHDQVIEELGEDVIKEYSASEEVWKQKDEDTIKAKLMEVFEMDESDAQRIVDEANNINGFNVYDEVKRQLISQGVAEDHIAFIHDAPTKAAKEALFKKVNDGDIRVLMGSTMKMGTGVNVQTRVVAMHHLDIGWRPSDIEQRNGRGLRRGNTNKEVIIKFYGTEGTIDGYMFDVVAKKQHGIDSFRAGAKGIREMEFEDGESMTAGEMAAAISGDTRLLDLEKLKSQQAKLRNRIESVKRANSLRQRRINDTKESLDYQRQAREITKEIAKVFEESTKMAEMEEEETVTENGKEKTRKVKNKVAIFTGEVDGEQYNTVNPLQRKAFYEALSKKINYLKQTVSTDRVQVGEIAGVPIYTRGKKEWNKNMERERTIELGEIPFGWDVSPVQITKSAKVINPTMIKLGVVASIRDIQYDVDSTESLYKFALQEHERAKEAPEVAPKEKDVEDLTAVTEKYKKLNEELKAEVEKSNQPKQEEKDDDDDESLEDKTVDFTKRSGDTFDPIASMSIFPWLTPSKVKTKPVNQVAEDALRAEIEAKNKEVEKRYREAAGVSPSGKDSRLAKLTEGLLDTIKGFTYHFKHLSPKKFAREVAILRVFETIKKFTSESAKQYVKGLVDPLTEEQYDIFTRRIIFEDLLGGIEKGLEDPNNLPFGFASELDVKMEIEKLTDLMEKEPMAKEAYDRRQDYMNDIYENLVARGILGEDADRKTYFHRRVLEYLQAEDRSPIVHGKSLAKAYKNWRRARTGTRGKDFSTNFIESEYKVVAEAWYELEKHRILTELMAPYENALKDLKRKFNKLFKKRIEEVEQKYGIDSEEYHTLRASKRHLMKDYIEENKPEGYTYYQPTPGNSLFVQKMVSEKQLEDALERLAITDTSGLGSALQFVENMIEAADPTVLVGAKRKQYLVPEELAAQLEDMAQAQPISKNPLVDMTSLWKVYILLMPNRVLKYNINNMVGDIDGALAADPTIFRHMNRAWQELKEYKLRGSATKTLNEAMRQNVIDSGWEVNELADLNNTQWASRFLPKSRITLHDVYGQKAADDLLDAIKNAPGKMWNKYWDFVQGWTRTRENVLRYAAYLRALEKAQKGENAYWASNPEEIDGITDPTYKAGKLAREVLGDYGNMSLTGQRIRRYMMPFYAWMEVNMRRYYRLLKNANNPETQRRIAGHLARKGVTWTAWQIIKANAMLAILTAAVEAWNWWRFPEEAEKMRRDNVRGMQLILSVDENGIATTLPIVGAFYDFIDFFGIPDMKDDLAKVMSGEIWEGLTSTIKTAFQSSTNKIAQGINPFAKAATEQMTRQQFYPDIYSPQPLYDRTAHAAQFLSLSDEYKALTNTPTRHGYFSPLGHPKKMVFAELDLGELAYYKARNIVSDWKGQREFGEGATEEEQARYEALRMYHRAIRLGNEEKAMEWLEIYYGRGGTQSALRKSEKAKDPLAKLNNSEKYDVRDLLEDPTYEPKTPFGQSLDKKEIQVFKDAIEYYKKSYRRSDE